MRQLFLLTIFFFLFRPLAGAAEPPPVTAPPKLSIPVTEPDTDLSGRQELPAPVPGDLLPLEIKAVFPSVVDACSLQQGRTIALSGKFPAQARVLLDGAVIPVETMREDEATFALPPLEAGMHQVQVAAGEKERRSLPYALFVDSVPKIYGVSIGEDQVTAYEVIVRGENFYVGSSLLVDGKVIRSLGGGKSEFTALPLPGREDFLRYIDCTTLLYVRHPVTREASQVVLRVVNWNGAQSEPLRTELP